MKTSPLFYVFMIIFTFLMTACKSEDIHLNEKTRLLDTDRQFAAMSLEKGAGEAFKHYLTEDAMSLSHENHPVIGRDKIYAGMQAGQESYTLAWEPQRAEVSASEDMGWTWGTYTLTFLDDKDEIQYEYGKYLNIWERQSDGQWRVSVDMGNSSPAPTEQ